MLAIQKYLAEHGLEKAINTFELKSRDYNHKILLKYDQLSSATLMAFPEVQDCRGIVLEKNTWKVMSLAFRKFFNAEESNAAKIDWNTASVLEKLDGSMIQLYYDWIDSKWYAGTTGTANGEGEVNNQDGSTFNQLFWRTLENKYSFETDSLNKDYIYVFELTTPYNIVVKPHGESSVTLLTVRDRVTLREKSMSELAVISESLGVPLVKTFDMNVRNAGQLMSTFNGMPWSEEGYVVRDGNNNRIKVKNPAYVAVHHLKGKTAEHNIMTIVKTNEIEEFAATFPERAEELYRLKENYNALLTKLNNAWEELKPQAPVDKDKADQKRYAMAVFDTCKRLELDSFTSLFFGLAQNRVKNVNEFLSDYDDKLLYKIL